MLTAALIVRPYPHGEPTTYLSPREIQLQTKPCVGERLQEGYESLLVTHVSHQLVDGSLVIHAEKE